MKTQETSTPETDEFILRTVRTDHNWRTFARKLERERDELREAVRNLRNLRDTKGRHNTGLAYGRLVALLP